MQLIRSIQNRIYEIRDQRVMLDRDLAALYETETKLLNLAVKRNATRFPPDFMFQLTTHEYESLRLQIETSNTNPTDVVRKTAGRERPSYLPFAFTGQGVVMLSTVLNSDKAVMMSITMVRAFVEARRILLRENDVQNPLRLIKDRLVKNDGQLSRIYEAMENLLDEKAAQRKWENRERIGFKR